MTTIKANAGQINLERTYICLKCNGHVGFATEAELQDHNAKAHTDRDLYDCPHCDGETLFFDSGALDYHIKVVHAGGSAYMKSNYHKISTPESQIWMTCLCHGTTSVFTGSVSHDFRAIGQPMLIVNIKAPAPYLLHVAAHAVKVKVKGEEFTAAYPKLSLYQRIEEDNESRFTSAPDRDGTHFAVKHHTDGHVVTLP